MKKIIVNLKDWLGLDENIEFAKNIMNLDITVIPNLPFLYLYKENNCQLGAQDISKYESGPHTGSISAEHLKELGVKTVILNHKECQKDEEKLKAKVQMASKYEIEVILCIASYEKDEINKIENIIKQNQNAKIIIAYEPLNNLFLEEIQENLNQIHKHLKNYNLTYVYGGNISKENIKRFNKELQVDGFLISSSALNTDELKTIIDETK